MSLEVGDALSDLVALCLVDGRAHRPAQAIFPATSV
jgi:hypothetical protein